MRFRFIKLYKGKNYKPKDTLQRYVIYGGIQTEVKKRCKCKREECILIRYTSGLEENNKKIVG